MRLSRKADYALRALVTLVECRGHGPISRNELAKRNDVPRRFLEHILLSMKSQGWVASSPGRIGGYVLALPPEQITLGQVVRFFDGIVAPIGCVSISKFEACSQSSTCRFRRVLLDIRNLTAGYLDNTTLAQVAVNQPVADSQIFRLEMASDDGIEQSAPLPSA
jgi:Rrf2 family protein